MNTKYYDHFATRPRNGLGVRAKLYQARRIFELGITPDIGPRSILEIGPGDGYIADLARDRGHAYLGVEASSSLATKLSAHGHNIACDFWPPMYPGIATFDACYALHVIEHVKTSELALEFVTAIRDRLLPGRSLVIATPDASRWGTHFYDCDYTHCLPFTARRLRGLLQAAGLKVTYESLYVGPVFGYAGVPFAALAKWLYTPTVDDLLRKMVPKDIASRGLLTALPNLIMVAKRSSVS